LKRISRTIRTNPRKYKKEINEIKKAIQYMKEEFNKDTESLNIKNQTETLKTEKFLKSSTKIQLKVTKADTWKTKF
jgi:hypothetical protein